MLTTHPHQGLRLRMGGVAILRPLYAFVAWAGTNLFVRFKFLSYLAMKYFMLMWKIKFKVVKHMYLIYALRGNVFRILYCRASNGSECNKQRTG